MKRTPEQHTYDVAMLLLLRIEILSIVVLVVVFIKALTSCRAKEETCRW